MKSMMRPLPYTVIHEGERRIDLPSQASLSIKSSHQPDLLRGAGLDFVVLDECAFMDGSIWSQVIRPMLADRQGKAIFLSTPYGRNWFWDIYQLGLNPDQADWASFQYGSEANPHLTTSELNQIFLTTPERIWREEYMAEFIQDAGQVFSRFMDCIRVPALVPSPTTTYVMGVDWGRDQDYTVLTVMDQDRRQVVAMVRFNRIAWSQQRGRLMDLAESWGVGLILAESNSIGSVNIEALQEAGLPLRPFQTSQASKNKLIEGLALAFETGQISIIGDEVLIYELGAYRLERRPSGQYQYGAPAGVHDDCLMSLALAYQACLVGARQVDWA
ncbi:hypothetical protein MASR2M15_04010 [Anaerolineales bacterium]